MRKVLVSGLLVLATSSFAAVFERFLDPNVPRDRAILNYLDLEKQGKASSNDLAELAVLLVEKGFPQDGERYLRRALKLDRKNVEARYRLGLVLQRLGEDGAAARQYRRVVKARPGFAEAQFMLALALERCGQRRAAIRAYAKAYKHNPDLANPAKNPLVLDSKLQTQAQLQRYRQEVASSTLKVQPLDPQAVRQMMLAKPTQPESPPSLPPKGVPKAAPTPLPSPSSKAEPGNTGALALPAETEASEPAPQPPSPQPTPSTRRHEPGPQRPLLPIGNASRPLHPRR